MGKSISILGYENAKAQLLLHFFLRHNSLVGKYQVFFQCPYCNVSSILDNSQMSFDYRCNQNNETVFLSCIISCLNPRCRRDNVAIEKLKILGIKSKSLYELIDQKDFFDLVDSNSVETEVVYPSGEYIKIIDYGKDEHLIPESIRNDYIEIQKTADVSPRATMVLARRLLERILLDKYPVLKTERNLEKMIENVPDSSLSKDTMDDMRIIGNKAIHISDPSNETELTNDDSSLAIHVLDDLLRELYIIPGNKSDRRKRLSELKERVSE